MKIIVFVGGALILGAALALSSIHTGLSTGWIGALGLLAWAGFVKRQWNTLHTENETEPGAPEKTLWVQTAGTGLILGHLAATLMHIDIDLHVGQGNTLAIDSWMMLAALFLAYLMFRKDYRVKDERDAIIEARGIKAGYIVLLVLLTLFSFILGFLPPPAMELLTNFIIGNIIIALMVASYLVQIIVRLSAYGTSVNNGYDEKMPK
ncbi:MAG: hypothetical protein JKX72_00445 [Robiginitomaculum sp.]|nr:hypothetical protein [Robiginitomaculum sp.]